MMTTTMTMTANLKTANEVRLMRLACWVLSVFWIGLALWLLWGPVRFTFASGVTIVVAGLVLALANSGLRKARERYIQQGEIPAFLKSKLRETYPQLTGQQADKVEQGLRDFFLASLHNQRRFLAMPSQAVDVLWHEFILHTQAYRQWCDHALGRFLDHTPAQALSRRDAKRNDGLRRIWYWACKKENIDPRAPAMLPLLFAIDSQLAIANGFRYVPDCSAVKSEAGADVHCGTSFSSGSYSGSSSDFGGAESSSSDSGGGGGSSDGGDGGGGCGGGGD
jgi:hypothetical protein